MLQSLMIKNVALIKNIDIEFGERLNILLGETGAGKSIIFDALNFVLGAKPDKGLIRSGENEMRVDAVFSNLTAQVISALNELGVEGDEIVLSRTLNSEGRSNIRVNGMLSSQGLLKEIGSLLVDSYSQHENVMLLKTKSHLGLVDRFGGESLNEAKKRVKKQYDDLGEIKKKINGLGGSEFERERKKSLLEYQIQEIESAELKEGEDEEIADKLKFFNNAEKIYEATALCDEALYEGNTSCIGLIQKMLSELSGFSSFENIESCRERLESVKYELEDIYETLKDINSNTDYDQKEFDRLDMRQDIIKSLTKKYGNNISKVLEFLADAKRELSELEDSDFLLQKYEKEKKVAEDKLYKVCQELTALRKQSAELIKNKMSAELKDLGMKSSVFDIKFEKLSQPSTNGIDSVEFVFSANKGQEVKSLSKTASGGELSRFMLAFKNIFASSGEAQTLIFDEIDSGISGETGNIVGAKLHNITDREQVICITHLPQVASFGNDFYFVSKKEDDYSTVTEIKHLNDDEIIYNLARMVVGDDVSQTALSQAEEMRRRAMKV